MGFTTLKNDLLSKPPQSLAAAWAVDLSVLKACLQALQKGYVNDVTLTGPSEQIKTIAQQGNIDISKFYIVEAANPQEGAAIAVRLKKDTVPS